MSALAEKIEHTPEGLLALPEGDPCELVDGELVEKTMGALSSWVGGVLLQELGVFVRQRSLGWVLGADCGYQCFPGEPRKVRKPDVSFIRRGRLPGEALPSGNVPIAPDLAVEVVSPNDVYYDLDARVADYLRAGVLLLWIINPKSRTALVWRVDRTGSYLWEGDELSGEEVIPGFRCPLATLFPPPASDGASPDAPHSSTA